MPFGEPKSLLETVIEAELTRAGEGVMDAATAKRIARAVAEAIEQNSLGIERQIRQQLQVSGLIV